MAIASNLVILCLMTLTVNSLPEYIVRYDDTTEGYLNIQFNQSYTADAVMLTYANYNRTYNWDPYKNPNTGLQEVTIHGLFGSDSGTYGIHFIDGKRYYFSIKTIHTGTCTAKLFSKTVNIERFNVSCIVEDLENRFIWSINGYPINFTTKWMDYSGIKISDIRSIKSTTSTRTNHEIIVEIDRRESDRDIHRISMIIFDNMADPYHTNSVSLRVRPFVDDYRKLFVGYEPIDGYTAYFVMKNVTECTDNLEIMNYHRFGIDTSVINDGLLVKLTGIKPADYGAYGLECESSMEYGIDYSDRQQRLFNGKYGIYIDLMSVDSCEIESSTSPSSPTTSERYTLKCYVPDLYNFEWISDAGNGVYRSLESVERYTIIEERRVNVDRYTNKYELVVDITNPEHVVDKFQMVGTYLDYLPIYTVDLPVRANTPAVLKSIHSN